MKWLRSRLGERSVFSKQRYKGTKRLSYRNFMPLVHCIFNLIKFHNEFSKILKILLRENQSKDTPTMSAIFHLILKLFKQFDF